MVFVFLLSSVLTHVLSQVSPIAAATSASSSPAETASSSQPLWSYQVKPSNYVNAQTNQPAHYSSMPSILDAFNGLSQRQGALSSSPFLSILPIILIAAGGLMLLLPLLTMMVASPFSGAAFGGYNNGFGYPQVGALSKKRSLGDQFGQRGIIDMIEQASSTFEELAKKFSNSASNSQQQQQRRAKAMNTNGAAAADNKQQQSSAQVPTNHRSPTSSEDENTANSLSNAASVTS